MLRNKWVHLQAALAKASYPTFWKAELVIYSPTVISNNLTILMPALKSSLYSPVLKTSIPHTTLSSLSHAMVCSEVYIYHPVSLNVKVFTGEPPTHEKKKKKQEKNQQANRQPSCLNPTASLQSINATFFCVSTNFIQIPVYLLSVGLLLSYCD